MFRSVNSIFVLIIAFVIIAFLWLKLTLVDEVIRADGVIEPEGKVQTVQPRFQGVLQELTVDIGDKVIKGELIASLNDEDSRAQLDENLSSLKVLDAEIIRLGAEVRFSKNVEWPSDVTQSLRVTQQNLFLSKRQNLQHQIFVIAEEGKLIENRISDRKQKIVGAKRLRNLKTDEKEIYLPLVLSGAEPKVRLVSIDQEIQTIENEIVSLKND